MVSAQGKHVYFAREALFLDLEEKSFRDGVHFVPNSHVLEIKSSLFVGSHGIPPRVASCYRCTILMGVLLVERCFINGMPKTNTLHHYMCKDRRTKYSYEHGVNC